MDRDSNDCVSYLVGVTGGPVVGGGGGGEGSRCMDEACAVNNPSVRCAPSA